MMPAASSKVTYSGGMRQARLPLAAGYVVSRDRCLILHAASCCCYVTPSAENNCGHREYLAAQEGGRSFLRVCVGRTGSNDA